MKISIVVPVFNEERLVGEVVHRVANSIIELEKEIIIVNDGSSDGTASVLEDLQVTFPIVKLSHLTKNQGKGAAVRHGLSLVTGSIVIIQDADLEYDPSDYHVLLNPIMSGKADVVYGSRFRGVSQRVLFFWHYVGNKLLTLLSNMLTNLNLTDMETGYKAFRSEIIPHLRLESNRFGMEPEFTVKVARMGLRIYEVPISYYGRTYENGKKITWRDGFQAIWTLLWYAVKVKRKTPSPLKQ